MKEMSVEQLKKYLENVIALEGQILTGEKAMEGIEEQEKKSRIKQIKALPEAKVVKRPEEKQFEDFHGEAIDGVEYIEEEPKSQIIESLPGKIIGALIIILPVMVIMALIRGLWSIAFWCCILFMLSIAFGIVVISMDSKKLAEMKEQRKVNNEKYEKLYEKEKARRIKEIEAVNRKEMSAYNKAVADVEKERNESTALNDKKVKSISDTAEREVKKIWHEVYTLKQTLNKFYAMDIIFPKYRNIFALCSIYEYLASGRCNSLEGHEGAYNIYESELRQDLILIKLDIVISQLEEIKQNQYMLYQEMRAMNSTLRDISKQMGEMLSKADTIIDNTNTIASNTQQIAQNTAVTALCAQMTAKNTEALKYISLVS